MRRFPWRCVVVASISSFSLLHASPVLAVATTFEVTGGVLALDFDGDSVTDFETDFGDENECPGESTVDIEINGTTLNIVSGSIAPNHFTIGGNHYIREVTSLTGAGSLSGTALSGTVFFLQQISTEQSQITAQQVKTYAMI